MTDQLVGVLGAEDAPEDPTDTSGGVVAACADDLRRMALRGGLTKSQREELTHIADQLDACAYTADVAAAVEHLVGVVEGLGTLIHRCVEPIPNSWAAIAATSRSHQEELERQSTRIDALAAAQGAVGALLGQALPDVSTIAQAAKDIRARGYRGWRKSQG